MRNVVVRAFLPFVLLVACASTWAVEPFSGNLKVVRVDKSGHRLFVAPAAEFVKSTATANDYIARLSREIALHLPDWDGAWSVSFFENPKYATFKDDPTVLEEVESGVWAKSYLAEYDNGTRRLVWFPLDPAKVRHAVIKGPK